MNELKELLFKLLEECPHLAIWVMLILYGYKVLVIGSIYKLLRFIVEKICDTVLQRKNGRLWSWQGMEVNDFARSDLKLLLKDVIGNESQIRAGHIAKLKQAWHEYQGNRE